MRTNLFGTPPKPAVALALAALVLGIEAATLGCGAAGPAPKDAGDQRACDPERLDACEMSIAQALAAGRLSREAVASYARARAATDARDPWAKLWNDLAAGERGEPAAIIEEAKEGASGGGIAKRVAAPHRAISISAPLPDPKAIAAEDLVLAMGEAAGAQHLVHIRGAKAEVLELFPRDPLKPFLIGLRPLVRGDADPAHIASNIKIAASIRRAMEAAGAFDYVKAATEADALSALLEGRDKLAEPVLRGRYALDLLSAAGLMLDPEDEASALDGAPPPAPVAPPPAPTDTPYGDLLRVRTAKDPSAEWPIRSAAILAAAPADRRDVLGSLFRKANDCSALRAPPMEGARDLVFAGRLATALDKGTPSTTVAANAEAQLPLPEWYRRYEIMARAVEESRTMWSHASSLLYERGEVSGLSPAATSTYGRVTELGVKHVAAVQALERAFPGRYRAFSHLGLVYSPGLLGDPALRDGIIRLTQSTVQDKLARAKDAKGVFEGALTGVFAGMSYPPAIQEAHYLALQGAFTAKLKGDLLTKTGWGIAGLYAADALFRTLTDQGKNLAFSSDQIARALSDPAISMPALATLTTSLARYAALGIERRLDPEQTKVERFPAERRAARDALKSAIAGLGEKTDEVPANVLEDVTELTDGLIATLSLAFGEQAGKAEGAVVCAQKKAEAGPSPAVRRSIARLSDVRRRLLLHPKYKGGDGAWVRRVRLLVTALSDAMDIAGKTGERPAFTIPAADAERAVVAALRDWDERAAADAIGGAYTLARQGYAAKSAETFIAQNGQSLRRVLGGLALFFKDEAAAPGKASAGVALLDALASMPLSAAAESDLTSLLLSYAEAFYAKKQVDQGDLWLLSTLVLAGLTESPPSQKVIDLAAKQSSRLEWALRFLADVSRTRKGGIPEPAAYEAGMRKAADDSCVVANADDVLSVMSAIRAFSSGSRKEARAALDRALESMETRGLSVPKMTYKYEEKTVTKVFAVTLGVSYGAGVLEGANTFQIGLGVKSPGEPGGSLTATLSPPDAAQAGEEAARYYVHTAALAAAYHFLEGDTERATSAARRAIDALASGVRLGSRTMVSAEPLAWGADARALIAMDAQLAAEAGLPFLAGDLLTMLRGSLAKDAGDKDIAAILATAPFGLAATKEAAAIRERAAKSLRVVAAPLACTEEKVELGGFEEASCEGYPLALSLRIADVLKRLPRLRPAAGASRRCVVLRALDTFLAAADKGTYDPDAFTAAVEELRAEGDTYSAAILLTRQRKEAHCSPAIVAASRALARSSALGPGLRGDLLGTAVNCALPSMDAPVIEDLLALDTETQRLADLTRNLRLLLSLSDLAVRQGEARALVKIVSREGFLDRWMRVNPGAATAALLIQRAALTISGEGASPEPSDRSQAAFSLLCETFPPGDRASLCASIKALRPPFTTSLEARQKLAKEALSKLLADASKPAGGEAPQP